MISQSLPHPFGVVVLHTLVIESPNEKAAPTGAGPFIRIIENSVPILDYWTSLVDT